MIGGGMVHLNCCQSNQALGQGEGQALPSPHPCDEPIPHQTTALSPPFWGL